jgi:hypothetical protein
MALFLQSPQNTDGRGKLSRRQFYAKGKEVGFSSEEIDGLRKIATQSGMADYTSLFQSPDHLDICMRSLLRTVRISREDDPVKQDFLAKISEFRRKIEMDGPKQGIPTIQAGRSDSPVRTQTRKSIRIKTRKPAFLSILNNTAASATPAPEFRCLIEDLSKTGCAVSIGGKAIRNMRLKLRFVLNDTPVTMTGTVRSVEYDEATNHSTLHIQADPLTRKAKDAIFKEMFDILPENEKILQPR